MTEGEPVHWVLIDHICKACGGRMLRSVKNAGMTPGGNPIFKCPDCAAQRADLTPDSMCWCGFRFRHHNVPAYKCLAFSKIKDCPPLEDAFLACGCDPQKGEVGIMLLRDYEHAIRGES